MLASRVQQTGFQHHQRLGPGSLLLPTFYIGVFSKISLGKKKKKRLHRLDEIWTPLRYPSLLSSIKQIHTEAGSFPSRSESPDTAYQNVRLLTSGNILAGACT